MNILALALTNLVIASCVITAARALRGQPQAVASQSATIEMPPFHFDATHELNPEENEYRVQLKQDNESINLNCKSRNRAIPHSETQNSTLQLELYLEDHFPFTWTNQERFFSPHTLSTVYRKLYDYRKAPSFTVNNSSKGLAKYFICRSFTPAGEVLLGWVNVEPPPSVNQIRVCIVYRAGHQWYVSEDYDVLEHSDVLWLEDGELSTRQQSDYTWVNVTSWRDIPDSAIIHSLIPRSRVYRPYDWFGCNASYLGLAPEKCYIERILSPGMNPFVLSVPEGPFQEGTTPKEARHVKLANGSVYQVLTVPAEAACKFDTLDCQETGEDLNLGQFREEVNFKVKVKEGNTHKWPVQQKVFRKINPKPVWFKTNPKTGSAFGDLAIAGGAPPHEEVTGNRTYLCRYRCKGSNECPGYSYQASNGSTVYRSIDRTIGYYTVSLSDLWLMISRWLSLDQTEYTKVCHVAFNSQVYSTAHFDEFLRLCSARLSYSKYNSMAETWTPVRAISTVRDQIVVNQGEMSTGKRYWYDVPLPFNQSKSNTTSNSALKFNSTLVVVNQLVHGEKVYIGRIERPNQRYLIGQINGTSGKITFAEEGVQVEEPIGENVDILTIDV